MFKYLDFFSPSSFVLLNFSCAELFVHLLGDRIHVAIRFVTKSVSQIKQLGSAPVERGTGNYTRCYHDILTGSEV